MRTISESIEEAASIGIGGHVRPDGDCVGSCLALCYYLKKKYPNKKVDVYLEYVQDEFKFLPNSNSVKHEIDNSELPAYDIFIVLDCGDLDRLGFSEPLFHKATSTINIDHHITNQGFAGLSYIKPEASSTCEVLMDLIDKDMLDTELASCLYLGIVHDTGVFKHSNTTKKTMELAAELISYDVPFSRIIDETFYQKTYLQNQILGRCLLESFLVLDGKCIVSYVKKDIMEFYGASYKDLDGVIDQMRVTEGVEVAILVHEIETQIYKVSMRSNHDIDVSKVAKFFGGGGHVKAAGCTISGNVYDVINSVTVHIEEQLRKERCI